MSNWTFECEFGLSQLCTVLLGYRPTPLTRHSQTEAVSALSNRVVFVVVESDAIVYGAAPRMCDLVVDDPKAVLMIAVFGHG